MKQVCGYLALTIGMAATAQSGFAAEADAAGAVRCIPVNEIKRTEVVDDQNILFHMRGGKVYNNHLPQRCNSLGFGKAFKYETSQHQLCNVDLISVISHSTAEAIPGAVCGLGLFVPVEPKKND